MFDYNIKTVLWIFTMSSLFMSSKTANTLLTFLLSYHVWLTSKIQVKFQFDKYWCLINCWHFQTIHVFQVLPRNSRSTSYPVQGYLKGTDNCILWIFTISSLFIFSRSRISLLTFSQSYDVRKTSIIRVNFRSERYWWFCLMSFWNIHIICVFEVR